MIVGSFFLLAGLIIIWKRHAIKQWDEKVAMASAASAREDVKKLVAERYAGDSQVFGVLFFGCILAAVGAFVIWSSLPG